MLVKQFAFPPVLAPSLCHGLHADSDLELPRSKVSLQQQLGIGEFGPIYDAEVEMGRNVVTRALVKVRASLVPRLTRT